MRKFIFVIPTATTIVTVVCMLCFGGWWAVFGAFVSSCVVTYFCYKKFMLDPLGNSIVEPSDIEPTTRNEPIPSNESKISKLESEISKLEDRLNRKIKECDCFVAERDKLAQRLSDTKDDNSKLLEGIQDAIHSLLKSNNKEDEEIMNNLEMDLEGIGIVVVHYTKDCGAFFEEYEGDSDMPVELLPALITQKEQEIVKKGIISVSQK